MLDSVNVLCASWKIPATYTIGEVLDFVLVESTSTGRQVRNSTRGISVNYDMYSKYHRIIIGQLCSC
jgi:hypothetical protein